MPDNSPRRAIIFDRNIGERIRLAREERGMRQAELGLELGVTFQQVQKYEKGTNRMSAARLHDAAIILNTSPHMLMGWKDNGRNKRSK